MSFDGRDMRIGLDVFSADGVYLGTVVWIRWHRSSVAGARGVASEVGQPPAASVAAAVSHPFSGERLGPMPTAALGNSGPARQTLATRYASLPDASAAASASRAVDLWIIRSLVSLNWATLRPVLRRVPAGLIQLVALERIILSVNAADFGG